MAVKSAKATNGNGHINRIEGLLPSKATGTISIPAMTMGRCEIQIVGETPLMVHRFLQKARIQMEQKQQGAATKVKEKRDPQEDYYGSMYCISGDPRQDKDGSPSRKCNAVHGMPAGGVKACMIRGAKAAGAVMADCRGAFFIIGDGKVDGQSMVKLDFEKFSRNDSPVTLQGTTRDMRYRCCYEGWSAKLTIEYNASQIGIAQLVNLLRLAGFGVGLCEWRPECGGELGRFTTGEVNDLGVFSR